MKDVELSFRETYFVMEDGETILPYDACGSSIDSYDPKVFRFIGKGVCCMISGIPQNSNLDDPENISYFFEYTNPRR
jgi:hypothetical protein